MRRQQRRGDGERKRNKEKERGVVLLHRREGETK
jgi:hypothetical protein